MANNSPFIWSSTNDGEGTADLGIYRNASGLLEVNTGTAGSLASLITRNIGIGTTTPGTTTPSVAMLQISTTSASTAFKPQLALSDQGATTNQKQYRDYDTRDSYCACDRWTQSEITHANDDVS